MPGAGHAGGFVEDHRRRDQAGEVAGAHQRDRGVFSAKIEKVFDPSKQDVRCDKCTDERKDQLVLGMNILRNVKKNPSDSELWDGGDILDPNNGKVYKVRLKPIDGGKKLEGGATSRAAVWPHTDLGAHRVTHPARPSARQRTRGQAAKFHRAACAA